jgi:hypothetical protein
VIIKNEWDQAPVGPRRDGSARVRSWAAQAVRIDRSARGASAAQCRVEARDDRIRGHRLEQGESTVAGSLHILLRWYS